MAPSSLDGELRRRAEATADAVLRDAKAQVERIATATEETIENRRSEVRRSGEEQYRAEARAAIAIERREAMRSLLLAKTALVDRVLQSAERELPSLIQSAAYRETLRRDVERALAFVGTEGSVVRCPPALEGVVREALRDTPSVSIELAEAVGSGFVAIGRDGTVVVDATLETRLKRLAPTLAIEIQERIQEDRR